MRKLLALAFVLAVALARPATAASSVIHLAGPADEAAQQSAANILGPNPGEFPSKAPGPISGREAVTVKLAPDGSVDGIDVDQTLTIHGTGDFSIEVSGPALHVVGAPDSGAQPGLRRGSVIWDGFSPGVRTVRATITLDPHAVRFLPLPLRASVAGGVLRFENQTALPRPFDDAVPDRASIARLLDAMRASLRAGRAPVAGAGGIPSSIPAASAVRTGAVDVSVPFAVDARSACAPAVSQRGTRPVEIAWRPGCGFDLAVTPSIPSADGLVPPAGAPSWSRALASASDGELRAALRLAQRTLWEGLRRREYEAYLGNPLGGTSRAAYRYVPAAALVPVPRAGAPETAKPVPIALALAGLALGAAGAVRWWLRN
jgi:hypothetical protein